MRDWHTITNATQITQKIRVNYQRCSCTDLTIHPCNRVILFCQGRTKNTVYHKRNNLRTKNRYAMKVGPWHAQNVLCLFSRYQQGVLLRCRCMGEKERTFSEETACSYFKASRILCHAQQLNHPFLFF